MFGRRVDWWKILGIRKTADYCCPQFQGLLEKAGKDGLAVIAYENDNEGPVFMLQGRACGAEEVSMVKGQEGVKLTLASQTGLLYCPACGVELARFYRERIRAIARPDLRV